MATKNEKFTVKFPKKEKTEMDDRQNSNILEVERRVNDVELALNNMKEWNQGFKATKDKINEIEGKVDKFYSNFLTIIITLIGLGSAFTLVYSTVITIIPSLSEFLIAQNIELKLIILTYLLFINVIVMLTIVSFYIIMLLMNNLIYINSNNKKLDLNLLKHIGIIFGFFVIVFILEFLFIYILF